MGKRLIENIERNTKTSTLMTHSHARINMPHHRKYEKENEKKRRKMEYFLIHYQLFLKYIIF